MLAWTIFSFFLEKMNFVNMSFYVSFSCLQVQAYQTPGYQEMKINQELNEKAIILYFPKDIRNSNLFKKEPLLLY